MEIAAAIGGALEGHGLVADVRPVEEVAGLEGYGAVVLGSAVQPGRWLGPARVFAEHHQDELRALPVWLFSSGPAGHPSRASGEGVADLSELVASTGAREHRIFPVRLDRRRLGHGLVERITVGAIRAPDGDARPWAEIMDWAAGIADSLRVPAPHPSS